MRILITNWTMIGHGGTQVFTASLASGLTARGHDVTVYSPRLGPFSARLAAEGVTVVDDLDAPLPVPDIIHGHQGPITAAALLRFPNTPAIYVCRSAGWWYDIPPATPRIVCWVAFDEQCREWLLQHAAPLADNIEIIPNRIDLGRFPPRSTDLPERPMRALVFVNHPRRVETVTAACRQCRLDLDGLGSAFGKLAWDPAAILERYNIVFTSSRKALESLCMGAAVILADENGLGGMVTSANRAEFARDGFGGRALTRPVTVDALVEEIGRYDPVDAAQTAEAVRADADMSASLDRYEVLYADAVAEFTARRDEIVAQEPLILSGYLGRWMPDPIAVAAPAVSAILTPDDRRSADADAAVARFVLPQNYAPWDSVISLHRR